MKVNQIEKQEFMSLVYQDTDRFLKAIMAPEAFIVQKFYPSAEILNFRKQVFENGLKTDPSWHPLYDSCPDYHRLHDNYPKAYVKQKMHAFYFHGWYEHNKSKFEYFREIFQIKNFLAGLPENEFIECKPTSGYIARVNIHHYPRGGGYQAEHIDPVGLHAQIQTLVVASQFGGDFSSGGLYARTTANSDKFFIDEFTTPGDLIVISPGIHHGVAEIDPEENYQWEINDGRWMILPIIVASDYPNPNAIKPAQVVHN